MDDMEKLLTDAIVDMDMQMAHVLIVENNVIPRNVDDDTMMLFIENAALLNNKPLLQEIFKYDSCLGGWALWDNLHNIEVATTLVLTGADLSVQQDENKGNTLLHELSASDNEDKLKLAELMIDYGADVSAVNNSGNSVLQVAIEGGAPIDYICKLVNNSVADFEKNAVIIADSYRCAELIPVLESVIMSSSLDEESRIERARDAIVLLTKLSPRHHKSRKKAIKALLKYVLPALRFDTEVNPALDYIMLMEPRVGGKVLWYMLNDIEVATMLVRAGADLTVRQDKTKRKTLLHVLVQSDDPSKLKLAELMIDHEADVSAVDSKGDSVLQYAIDAGVPKDFIEKLIWNTVTEFEKTAVAIADNGRTMELMPTLVSFIKACSVDEETRNERIKDVVYSLIDCQDLKVPKSRRIAIKYLFKNAMPSDMFDSRAYAILVNLILSEDGKMAKLFFQRGADPNSEEHKGILLLCWAASMEVSTMTTLLIKCGADIHRQSQNGSRPIHGACMSGSTNNILLLIRLGVDINVVNNLGQTPLSILTKKNPPSKNDLYRLIIRRLVLKAVKGETINNYDIDLIRRYPILQELFDSCVNELQQMQTKEVIVGVTYFEFLAESIEKMSISARRKDLQDVIEDETFVLRLEQLFPIYGRDFLDAYIFAAELEKLVLAKQDFLNEIFFEAYQFTLPGTVIQKLVNYLSFDDEIKNFILEYHSSTFCGTAWI